jgi:outer membrane autotransporter protein
MRLVLRGTWGWGLGLAVAILLLPAPAGATPQVTNDCHNSFDSFLGSSSDFADVSCPSFLTAILGVGTDGGIPGFVVASRRGTVKPDAAAIDGDAQGMRGVMGRLGVFTTFDFEHLDKKDTTFEDGFEAQTYSGTIGADFKLTSWLVTGAAFTVKGLRGTLDADQGDVDMMSYGLTLYASLLPVPNLFVDVYVAGALKDYGYQRAFNNTGLGIRGLINGETDGDEVRAGAAVGYDFVFGSASLGPRLAVNWAHNTLESFAETGNTGLEVRFDKQHHSTLTLRAGAVGTWAVSIPIGVLTSQGSVEYVHEFMDDQRVIYYRFRTDPAQTKLRFLGDPPDRNYWQLGVAFSLQLARGITPYVSYRALAGYADHSAHSFAAGLRLEF